MLRVLAFVLAIVVMVPTAPAQRRGGIGWAEDGIHLDVGGVWQHPLTGETATRPEPKDATPSTSEAIGARFTKMAAEILGRQLSAKEISGVRNMSTLPRTPEKPGVLVSEDGNGAVVLVDGRLIAWIGGDEARVAAKDIGEAVRRMEIAPDGGAVSFIEGFDLVIWDLRENRRHALSQDGSENLFYGELDWVYQEEVYGRYDFKATWWAPTGTHLAYLRTDEAGVDTFTVVDHRKDALELEHLKYPKSGTTNPRASLHVADARTGAVVAADLSRYQAADEILVVRVGWRPNGEELYCMIQNREQTWLDLVFVDPASGASRVAIHEEAEDCWINVPALPDWLADGSFLWESERTGFKHLYRYDVQGKLLAAVTAGDWELKSILHRDEKAGHISFMGTKDSAVGLHAYRVGLDGKNLVRLTEGRGSHTVRFNATGDLLTDSFTNLENPGEVWLRRADGTAIRQLQAPAPLKEGARYPRLESIKARDGEMLDVTVTLPQDFDETASHPVWIETYSGPDAATVRDSFRGPSSGFFSQNGVILLQVNVRSASGRGQRYTKACYRQFGVQELKDIEDAVDWLTAESWADASRVGIGGWSYGGFMAAFALTHSTKFKCGIAGAGVYDWRLYDTIYTERYMAKPQNNPAGYSASSVIEAAGDLHGELLIVHGTMDDNVHMQNAIQLIDALNKANKLNYTFTLYPGERHGVRSNHLRLLREKFIREKLF